MPLEMITSSSFLPDCGIGGGRFLEILLLHDVKEFMDELLLLLLFSVEEREFLDELLLLEIPLPPPANDFNELNDDDGLIKHSWSDFSVRGTRTCWGRYRNNPKGCSSSIK